MRLYYSEQGSGKPMILLHGNGEDGSYFRHQTEYFSKNYHVFVLDTRGHGRSPRGTAPFTLRQFAADLKNFLDEKNLKDIILLGFSDGGNIALIFTLLYPEYVDQLVLNGANLNPFGMKFTVLCEVCLGYAAVCLELFACRVRGCHGEENKAPSERSAPARKKEFLGLMAKEPWIRPERLREIRVPTLVIAGTRDMIRESHTRLIHRQIPGSRLQLVRGNHFIAKECPGEFNRAVGRFLACAEKPGRKK